jgi:phage terminase large subunit-like protein
LEDAMHVLGMTSAKRTRGRKAAGYRPVRTFEDVVSMVLEEREHSLGGSVEGL